MLEKPRVDRAVELMSIAWRLAGKPEYSRTDFKLYTDRIEAHFGKHKNHELIGFVKTLIADHSISYNAVASMALHLDDYMPRLAEAYIPWVEQVEAAVAARPAGVSNTTN
jgi:hypothetical protein